MKKLSRKERRKAEQHYKAVEQLKKGTTIFSSALAVSSIASTAALLPGVAEATDGEADSAEIAPSATDTYLDNIQTTNIENTADDSWAEETASSEIIDDSEMSIEETIQSEAVTEESTAAEENPVSLDERTEPAPFAAASASVSTSSFINSISGHAQTVAAANDLYTSVMIAQAILESGSGASSLAQAPYYNLFGIKGSYNGQSVYMNTWEYLNGEWVAKNEAFRKYPSFTESFHDNAYVLRNTSFQSGVYYYSGAWKSNTSSYRDATAWLTGRYATDPAYGAKLNTLIEANNLTQYDTPSTDGNTGGNTDSSTDGTGTGGGSSSNNQDVIHTVVSGDSLWALASKYGTTITNIKNWNNLFGDTIYIGQKLVVQKGSGTSSGGSTGDTGGSSSDNNNNNSDNTGTTTNTYYTVKSGDSLWVIANSNGVSIANLRSWNNISGDLIYPGQRLIVKKGSSTSSDGGTGSTGESSSDNNNSGNTGTTTDTYYTVKSGDSLWVIANSNGVSIANLRSWNNISGDLIYPGQRLIVKKGGSTGNTNTGGSSSNNNNSGSTGTTTDTYYTVKSGDSLWVIANSNGVSIANLRSWNNISGDLIYPGQRLIVKKGSGASSGGSSGSTNNSNSSSSKTHLVKSGDTLWELANQYSTTIQKIKQLNNLTGDIIYIGQQLKVA
ncbi:LysM peptidoglycan-binding domain-containing protein [Enterococcus sp. BWB1-3]|uniref:muramidase family protein n=1 Tax=Enterococcus sp. BWB1-3 TaxID=2787713 RepID=UPI001923482C|nr:LysM peptidoglycan-binding domain-containing protein [Enterococcus sp. BWB1-3]MBL1227663.1 LysM peptidoglycan-binding domain-containing protein [Enterococcus sp. BWB1-3]